MPFLSTKVDLCRGHDACPPRPFAEYSSNVFAEGFEVTREGDSLQPHGCPKHPPHGAKVTEGYPSVKVNGKRVAYAGACVDCASKIVNSGRPSVLLGEGKGAAAAFEAPSKGDSDSDSDERKTLRGGDGSLYTYKKDEIGSQCRSKTKYTQETGYTCGISSARMVINDVKGINVSEEEIARRANGIEMVGDDGKSLGSVFSFTTNAGTAVDGLPAVLATYGVDSHAETLKTPSTAEDIDSITNGGKTPAIVLVKSEVRAGGSHIVIVDGMDDQGNVLIRDPGKGASKGCRKLTLKQFNQLVWPEAPVVVLGSRDATDPQPTQTRPMAKPDPFANPDLRSRTSSTRRRRK